MHDLYNIILTSKFLIWINNNNLKRKTNVELYIFYHSDATKSADSFEELWVKMGEELEKTAFPPL